MGAAAAVTGLQAGSAILGAFGARAQARAEKEHAERQAYIGETRALQTAAGIGEQLNSEMATLRSTLAANGQGMNVGTLPFAQELRRIRGREIRVGVANERQGAADWRMTGRNAESQGRAAFLSGLMGAGTSLFDMGKIMRGPQSG